MAKFCGYCGSQMDDHAKVCGNCGNPLAGESTKVKVTPPVDKKKLKVVFILAFCVAALVFVAVLGVQYFNQNTGYNGLIRKTMAAYEDGDVDALMDLCSEILYHRGPSYTRPMEGYFEYLIEYLEDEVGKNYKLSYEIEEVEHYSKRELKEMREDMETYYEMDGDILDDAVVVEISVEAKKSRRSADVEIEMLLTKEKGVWRIYSLEYGY